MGSKINPVAIDRRNDDGLRFYGSLSLYLHLVTVEPNGLTEQNMSDLTFATGGNYSYASMGSSTVTETSNGSLYNSTQNGSFSNLTTDGTPIVGGVVSDTTSTSSGIWIAYIEYTVAGSPAPYTPDGSTYEFNTTANGFWSDVSAGI